MMDIAVYISAPRRAMFVAGVCDSDATAKKLRECHARSTET